MLRELIGKLFGIWEVVELFEGRKVVELVIAPTINLLIDELTINMFDDGDETVVICEFLEWKKYTHLAKTTSTFMK